MSINVLIVDDHAGFRSLARSLLETDGYIVVGEAADGTSALAAATVLKPALILLDVQLPDRDGFAVARELTKRCPDVLIVLISTRDARDYGRRLDESGALGFIPKGELSSAALTNLLTATH
ncbi:MAG: response regulator transcription factor [Actinomycetota bacterium]|nr:response regulator transcription factor [Actinomycetota bacterium]